MNPNTFSVNSQNFNKMATLLLNIHFKTLKNITNIGFFLYKIYPSFLAKIINEGNKILLLQLEGILTEHKSKCISSND